MSQYTCSCFYSSVGRSVCTVHDLALYLWCVRCVVARHHFTHLYPRCPRIDNMLACDSASHHLGASWRVPAKFTVFFLEIDETAQLFLDMHTLLPTLKEQHIFGIVHYVDA